MSVHYRHTNECDTDIILSTISYRENPLTVSIVSQTGKRPEKKTRAQFHAEERREY